MTGQGINGTISNPADWTISEPEAPTISGFARRYPRALRLADVEEGKNALDDGGHVVVFLRCQVEKWYFFEFMQIEN